MGKALLILLALASPAVAGPAIEFSGNTTIPASTLRAQMAPGSFDQQLLRITAYYWDHGYARVEIGEPVIERDRVTIPVSEGEVFTIAGVAVTGSLVGDAQDHLALVAVHGGDKFSRSRIVASTRALTQRYIDRGYASANVIPLTKIDLDTHSIALTFEIDPGQRTRLPAAH